MSKSSGKARLVSGALVALLLASCTSTADKSATSTTTVRPGTSVTDSPGTAATGPTADGKVATGAAGRLTLRLSKGVPLSAATGTAAPLVRGTELGANAIAPIVARLSPWVDDAALPKPFNWPTQSLPVPRAGTTVSTPFPAADTTPPPSVPTGTLEVTRVQPEGAVTIAPFVTITFNQPMVPVATLAPLDSAKVPATITPTVPGHWLWIGTKTLRFDADSTLVDRLPMATPFTVTVPAGATSATGGALAKDRSFTFRTPPVTVQSMQPESSTALPLVPVFVATFDQRVDPAEVLKHVELSADGAPKPVRLATADEVKADRAVHTESLTDGRWIAVRPVDPLPANAAIKVAIKAGAPSAEGPLLTTAAQAHDWRTYPPLTVTRAGCGGGDCPPASPMQVELSNPLDAERFDATTVTVSPDLPGLTVNVYGNVLEISGRTKARTTYEITLPAALVDTYGQSLGTKQVERVKIGPSQPMLEQFGSAFTTVDPLVAKPSIVIGTVNYDKVRLRVFAVQPSDWDEYRRYAVESQQQLDAPPALPAWRVLTDRTADIKGKADERTETRIDLSSALGGDGLGHVVALVEPTTTYRPDDERYWQNRPTVSWVQSTKLGVDVFRDSDELRVWATDLATGAPIGDVAIAALGSKRSTKTGADGVGRISLADGSVVAVTATRGGDTAMVPRDVYRGSWDRVILPDEATWYVVDDRHTYRPGETVSVKGYLRRFDPAGEARLHVVPSGTVHYVVTDGQGIQIADGSTTLTPLGGFDFSVALPAGVNQGQANIMLTTSSVAGLPDAATKHQFAVQEFRRPEFAVTTRTDGDAPLVSSRPATVAVDANYYAGGPLGAAPVTWAVTTSKASYSPPGWNEWSFGEWTPWWYAVDAAGVGGGAIAIDKGGPGFPGAPVDVKKFTGTTDASGSHYLKIDFAGANGVRPDLPVTVRAEATVEDVNRQVLASSTSALVHPSDFYVGLRGRQTFVKQGDPLDIDAIVTAIDGKVSAGRAVHVTASRTEWTLRGGEWVERPVDTQTCDRTSTTDPVSCSFTTKIGGTYKITATVADDRGAQSRTELTRWVSGGEGRPDRTVARQNLTIVPASADNRPGTTPEILVQAPFAQGHGIVTIRHVGIDATQQFDVVNGSAVVRVPLTERDVPVANLSFEVVGTAPRTGDDGRPLAGAPDRPAFAVGSLALKVSTASRALTVKAEPAAATLAPGQSTTIGVTVTGPNGQPVAGSELALAVVDEAVLALGPSAWPDPLEVFYGARPSFDETTYGRESITLAAPQDAAASGESGHSGASTTAAAAATTAAAGAPTALGDVRTALGGVERKGVGGVADGSTAPIDQRTNFDALAVFKPSVLTDAAGQAVVDVTLPDNLTRYRVMVVAVHGDDQFGSTDAAITARKPLAVRPSAPRFLNFGDTFELPIVVQNQTDKAMSVDVALQASNLAVTGAPGRRVDVPANDRVEVRFPVSAVAAGTARFRVAAVSGASSDATTIELPVYTPVTTEAFATYGVVDGQAVAQPVLAPTGVIDQFGGLDITTSSTALQGLTDAVLSIVNDRYESTDAHASRIMTITSLRDVLAAFDPGSLPSRATLDATITGDIAGIVALQNGDGGFAFWERDRPSDPYVSIQATHALVVARTAGFPVPNDALPRAQQYLSSIESHFSPAYGETVRDALSSYALHVRQVAGDRDIAKAEQLWNARGDKLGVDAIAWLWPVVGDAKISADMLRRLENRAVETAGSVNFASSYGDDAYLILQSDRRVEAIVLDALIAQRPDSDLIPKVVTGLLGHRTGGRWASSEESSFILIALKKYFDAYERQTPDFVARVWLGDRYAGDQTFNGRSTDRLDVHLPTTTLAAAGNSSIVVAKEGTGRLYYRIGLTYAPADLQSAALDRGFVVQRTYEGVDHASDVTREATGVWHIKAGANVRVKLTMVAESQRTHVALVDPLPAGFEIVNPVLATAPEVQTDPTVGKAPAGGDVTATDVRPFWYPTWFEHQNLKDDRAEVFTNLLPAGSYDYTYVARATTPGSFVTPPTRAEQIYAPETFGRSASTKVVIEVQP